MEEWELFLVTSVEVTPAFKALMMLFAQMIVICVQCHQIDSIYITVLLYTRAVGMNFSKKKQQWNTKITI